MNRLGDRLPRRAVSVKVMGSKSELRAPGLVVVHEAGIVRLSLPDSGRVLVGKGDDCDLVVAAPALLRKHAVVMVQEEILLENLGRKGDVRVDGVELGPGDRTAVSPTSWIQLGHAVLQLRESRREFSFVQAPDHFGEEPLAPQLEETRGRAKTVAQGEVNVMIVGETGAGKEVLARYIQGQSRRANATFSRVNCASLNDAQAEAQFFGYEPGAFLGAEEARIGLLEGAHGGTLFLDDVGELAPVTQEKLLQALLRGVVTRLGSPEERPVSVRILSTTDRDVQVLVQAGAFREDLYLLLTGAILEVPPLRQRREDILPLAREFLEKGALRVRTDVPKLAPETENLLLGHSWPGNIRELRSVMDRAVLLADGGIVLPEHCALESRPISIAPPFGLSSTPPPDEALFRVPPLPDMPAPDVVAGGLKDEVRELEKRRIMGAIDECGGNQTKAARLLGISRRALLHRLDAYGLPRPRKGSP